MAGYAASNPPNTPTAELLFDDEALERDAHGPVAPRASATVDAAAWSARMRTGSPCAGGRRFHSHATPGRQVQASPRAWAVPKDPHSYLNACIGFTLEALLAGMYAARTVTASTIGVTRTSASTSL